MTKILPSPIAPVRAAAGLQRFLHFLELVGLDDCFNFVHRIFL
jgi:hypothetical protein